MVGPRRNPTSGKTGLPKIAAQRDFWEEERQAQRAERQAKRAVCHGALPATSRRSVASRARTAAAAPRQFKPLLHPHQYAKKGMWGW